MTLPPNKLGDQGQRYEIRAEGYPNDGMNVIGWSEDRDQADHIAGDIIQAPSCNQSWVIDRDFICAKCGDPTDLGAPDRKDTVCPKCCEDHDFQPEDGWAMCIYCGEDAPPDYFDGSDWGDEAYDHLA